MLKRGRERVGAKQRGSKGRSKKVYKKKRECKVNIGNLQYFKILKL